ncbi:hypothetical protein [Methanoculleus chikugoensis]|uniref:hypothetical protein n=1 Tax=Methanoculleus chikugoensis TaxID=118126 RepID=UPI0006D13D9A|nr:hypothetical protein [Methanoculleus chikugoensis]
MTGSWRGTGWPTRPGGISTPASPTNPARLTRRPGEFVEAVGGLFDLVREDPATARLLSEGGEIAGVVVVCPPSAASEPGGPGDATLRSASGTGGR